MPRLKHLDTRLPQAQKFGNSYVMIVYSLTVNEEPLPFFLVQLFSTGALFKGMHLSYLQPVSSLTVMDLVLRLPEYYAIMLVGVFLYYATRLGQTRPLEPSAPMTPAKKAAASASKICKSSPWILCCEYHNTSI